MSSLIQIVIKAKVALEMVNAGFGDLIQVLVCVPINGFMLPHLTLCHINAIIDLLLHLHFFLSLCLNHSDLFLLLNG